MLVARGDVVQRPVGGESSEADAGLAAELGGGQAREGAKLHAERSQALVAEVEADVRNAVVLGQQELLGLFHANPGDEFVRRLSERLREQPLEVKRRKTGVARGLFEGDSVAVASTQIIAGTR